MNGHWAERLAACWLILHGWRIVARNHAGRRGAGIGEVDIIARRGQVLAFVEVKFRPTLDQAAAAITARQQRRIAQAARTFIAANPPMAGLSIRCDAVLVAPWRWPLHVPDGWHVQA